MLINVLLRQFLNTKVSHGSVATHLRYEGIFNDQLIIVLSFSLTPHSHLIILISERLIFNSCSTFISLLLLPCIRQLLTQVAYTLPFSFNENPFPVRMGRYSRNFFQADLTLLLLNHILHLRPTYLLNNRIYLLFQRYSITNIQMQISIKSTCDWYICLTASADERLACTTQTSFHSTTSFMLSPRVKRF